MKISYVVCGFRAIPVHEKANVFTQQWQYLTSERFSWGEAKDALHFTSHEIARQWIEACEPGTYKIEELFILH